MNPTAASATPTLHVEAPDSTALVRFLSAHVAVEVTLRVDEVGRRHVEIETRASDGEGSSSFKYEVAGPTFPPYETESETEPTPKPTRFALVRLPFDKYGFSIDDPEAHQRQYPHLTHWRDAVHDGRRVDGIYMLVPGSDWAFSHPQDRYISLTLVGVEIEWPEGDLDDEAREALHECEDEVLKGARAYDHEYVDIYSKDLFVSPGVWRDDALYINLGEFATFEEALEHWSANPPYVPYPPCVPTAPPSLGKE